MAAILESGVVELFFSIIAVSLRGNSDKMVYQLKYQTLWLITNLFMNNATIEKCATPRNILSFIRILSELPSEKITNQALWALANIAGSTIEIRNSLHA